MDKNWHQIDRMALDSALFLLDYCDTKVRCSDCIFNDEKECAIRIGSLSLSEKFLKEVKSHVERC